MKLLTVLLFLLPFSAGASPCPDCKADFAIYAPGIPGDGVWRYEVESLMKMFERFHWSYELINFNQVRSGYLGQNENRKFHGLVMPGGPIDSRLNSLGPEGKIAIDNFIKGGGNYIGFCGGSYITGESFVWASHPTGENRMYYQISDYHIFEHAALFGAFPGIPTGPLAWAPYNDGLVADGLEPVELNLSLPILRILGVPQFTKLFYFGGPFFHFRKNPQDLEVWARAVKPNLTPPEASTGDGQPTIIRYHFGLGNMVLFSYHPVVLIGGEINGVKLQEPMRDRIIKTDPTPFTLDQVNLRSWNLLHGALQLTADQAPTPLELK